MNAHDEFYIAPPDPNAPKTQHELITIGMHQAVCCQIHNLGFQSFKGGAPSLSPKCALIFEVDQKMSSGTLAGKPMVIAKTFPMFMGNNAKGAASALKVFIQGWRGRPLTEAELQNFSLRQVLSRPCILMIAHVPKLDGTMKADIVSILPAPPGVGWAPTYLEVPKWIADEKARQVYPQQAGGPVLGANGAPADW
jgi:hypothetical protein